MDIVHTWTVTIRADGCSDVDANLAARLLKVADLGGEIVDWGHEQRSVTAHVIVKATSEHDACENVLARVSAVLDPTWIINASAEA